MKLDSIFPAVATRRRPSIRALEVLSLIIGYLTIITSARAADVSLFQFAPNPAWMPLVHQSVAAPIFLGANDWPGVLRAARDLRSDIERVTKIAPALSSGTVSASAEAVLIGTIGRSSLIDSLIAEGKLDVTSVRGRWEAFAIRVVDNPLPGISRALVIAGSDKRGTIYGIYEVSAQIGVSPWSWWADVPVARHDEIFVGPTPLIEAGPSVKYRGIFLNDEAPALTGWAREKFGGLNHEFYEHVFELLLRLKANYLWPAMWNNAFNEDDPLNPKVADEYGIVMGTSHHEPMIRSQQEWKRHGSGAWNYATNGDALRRFWADGVRRNRDLESIVTIGMRGDGDEAMSEETNVGLLERIVGDQRKILQESMGRKPSEIPQLWALYKEVQAYYEHGMRVPDDVTLLWCDDNWGNIRRLPTPEERKRSGGAGVYYHFDYVGGPRNYKWLNTVPITKVWEQMHLAWTHGADRIWIVNVGDLKPVEFPIEFFLRYAWRPDDIPYEQLDAYSSSWTQRQFGAEQAQEIASLINGYTKLNGRRKPELLDPDTFSLINYREAERVLEEWRTLLRRAEKVEPLLPADARPAFFQLVRHPIEACRVVNELYVSTGLNRLYATQGRASTNALAARAREWFQADATLARRWDEMLDGKWRHMMDQTHLGYTSWQQPIRNAMPAVTEVQLPSAGSIAVAVEGDPAARPGDYPIPAVAKLPPLSRFGVRSRWFEIFNRGQAPARFTMEVSEAWLKTDVSSGDVGPDVRVEVSADWSIVPTGLHPAKIVVRSSAGDPPLVIALTVDNTPQVDSGFVEADGHVALESPHFSRRVNTSGVSWRSLPDFGPGVGAMTAEWTLVPGGGGPDGSGPRSPSAESPEPTVSREIAGIHVSTTARLEYDVILRSTGEFPVEVQCAPSFDFQPSAPLAFAVSFDDQAPQVVRLGTWTSQATWDRSVADGVRRVTEKLQVKEAGRHVLKIWAVTPGVVLERIVINTGGVRPSYLGAPESPVLK